MEETKNLQYLKNKMYLEINDFYTDKETLDDLKNQLCFCKEVEEILNFEFNELKDNLILLDIQLQQLSGIDSEKIYSIVYSIITNIETYASNPNYENEFSKEISKLVKIKNIFINLHQELSDKIQLLYVKQKNKEKEIIDYKKILSNFKNNYVINNYQLYLIHNMIEKYEFEEKEEILVLEQIKNYNKKIIKPDYNSYQTIITTILTKELEDYEMDDYHIDELDNKARSIYNSIIVIDNLDEINNYLPELETGLYTLEEYDYIFKRIMNKIINSMKDNQTELAKKETYFDYDLCGLFISDFIDLEKLLNKTRYFYNTGRLKYQRDQNINEDTDEKVEANHIFFSHPKDNEISYMEKDLQKLPEETLGEVKKLIERFRYDELRRFEIKNFNSSNKKLNSYRELRGDQIRILFKNIENNNYLFMGVGQKKEDMDRNFYINCVKRDEKVTITDEEIIKSNETYDRVMNFIEENKRKGNRY